VSTGRSVKSGRSARLESATGPAAFFASVQRAFERAAEAAGGKFDFFYQIGESTVRLCFAGSALVPFITPAFEHLAQEPCPDPSLTVLLWDSASTGVDMPRLPPQIREYVNRGELWRFKNERFKIGYQPINETFDLLDKAQNVAIYRTGAARNVPQYETGSPLLQILHWWTGERGQYLIHAAAVGTKDAGVLLVGKGGSGKSTAALACLNSQLMYVSDDYCLLSDHQFPYVYSLYNTGKLNKEDVSRFPFLKPALSDLRFADSDKALYFINRFPDKIARGVCVRAILVVQATAASETTLQSISSAAALLALAPSTVFQFPGIEQRSFRSMGTLVKQVPCYALKIGRDLSSISRTILRLLSRNPGYEGLILD
jgi:hypothetical protein